MQGDLGDCLDLHVCGAAHVAEPLSELRMVRGGDLYAHHNQALLGVNGSSKSEKAKWAGRETWGKAFAPMTMSSVPHIPASVRHEQRCSQEQSSSLAGKSTGFGLSHTWM